MNTYIHIDSSYYFIYSLEALAFLTVIGLIIRTVQRKTCKKFENSIKTTGIVDKVHPETSTVDCSYTDHHGERHTASFLLVGARFKKGDKIELFFDTENPEKSIPACKLNSPKTFWPKFLFCMAAVIALSLLLLAVLDYTGIGKKLMIWRRHRRYFR